MILFLKHPVFIILITQLLYTTGDLIARDNMRKFGFEWTSFLSIWFLIYFALRQVAMFLQLYVFAYIELGKSMAMFGAASIVLSNLFGLLFLGELLSLTSYIGISLAISAFLTLALL